MKIKTKLLLGVGFLLLLIVVLSLVATTAINALKSDTENILVANYKSLEYSRNILQEIEKSHQGSMEILANNIQQQEKNITEPGEIAITENLRKYFEEYKSQIPDSTLLSSMRVEIYKIMDLNMLAIQRKSLLAQQTAITATFWIAITGTLCFIFALVLFFSLPASIANPMRELTESIKQIAANKYSERVHFEKHNELGELARSFNTMAEKLEEYNNSNLAKLMIEKKRIDTLINNMNDPVIGLDENLKVIFANDQALKITGLKSSDLIGEYVQTLASRNDLIKALIQDLMIAESSYGKEKTKPIKIYADGKESYFEKTTVKISIVPTGEQNKIIIGHVIILKNVTTYKELDFAKTNFIATVSHEFKTPISSIKMSTQLLENDQIGALNNEQKNLVESIKDDANRLLKITGELLNMTQIESGNIQLTIIPADPKEILLYAINATKTQADQKHLKFEINCPENLPKVQADSEKTAWVLTNLISNAIRYSNEHASIYLTISADKRKVNYFCSGSWTGYSPSIQG